MSQAEPKAPRKDEATFDWNDTGNHDPDLRVGPGEKVTIYSHGGDGTIVRVKNEDWPFEEDPGVPVSDEGTEMTAKKPKMITLYGVDSPHTGAAQIQETGQIEIDPAYADPRVQQ